MTKYLPSILAVVSLIATSFSSQIQAFVSHFLAAHPVASVVYGSVFVIVSHMLPSPLQPKS